MTELGRRLRMDIGVSARRKWLIINGIAGYASGKVSGVPTRRYHILLVAALHPPLCNALRIIAALTRQIEESGTVYEELADHTREGLIPQPPRPEGGIRRYPQDAVSRILFIRRSKALGFSLREIKELLSLRVDSKTTCAAVKGRAETKIEENEGKVRHLREMKRALVKLTAACRGNGPMGDCPILEALGQTDRTPAGREKEEERRPRPVRFEGEARRT